MNEETSNKDIPAVNKDQNLKVTDAKENVIKETIPTVAEKKNSEKENQHRDMTRNTLYNFENCGEYFNSNPMKEKQISEDSHQFRGMFGRDKNGCCHPYYFRNGVNTVPDHSNCLCCQKHNSNDNECKDSKPENLDKGKHEEVHSDNSSQMGHFRNHGFSNHSESFDGRNCFRRPHYSDTPPFFNRRGHHGIPGGGNYCNVPCFYGGPNHYVGPECYEGPSYFNRSCVYGDPGPFINPGQFGAPGHFGIPCYYGGPDHFVDPRYFQSPNSQEDTCQSDENYLFQMPSQGEDSRYSPNAWHFNSNRHFGRPENFGQHGPFYKTFPSYEKSQQDRADFPFNSRHDKQTHNHSSRHFARRNYFRQFSKLNTPIEERPIFREFDFC